jgi:uncharacterized membrane protein
MIPGLPQKTARLRYIDWARGIAVLVMIEAHTLDAWTLPSERSSVTYRNLIVVGGFAAPLFLWLAGLASVLSAERAIARGASRRAAAEQICRRGLEIFILAFLFRIQSFVVSPGNSLLSLFRVDILNLMGPALVATGIVWGLCRRRWAATTAFAVLTTAIAMATPVIRSATWIERLLQWYLRPSGQDTVFTGFPWAGFVFAGAALGMTLAGVSGRASYQRRLQTGVGVVGVGLVAFGFYTATLPTLYRASSFWTSSPTYFCIRVGVMMAALSTLYWVDVALRGRAAALIPLERLGRSSLFVYWIHVELVYGYASWPLRRHLRLWQAALAYGAFSIAMYGAVRLRDWFVARRSSPAARLATGQPSAV